MSTTLKEAVESAAAKLAIEILHGKIAKAEMLTAVAREIASIKRDAGAPIQEISPLSERAKMHSATAAYYASVIRQISSERRDI